MTCQLHQGSFYISWRFLDIRNIHGPANVILLLVGHGFGNLRSLNHVLNVFYNFLSLAKFLSQLMAQFFGVNYNKMAEPVLKNDEHVDFDSNLWD